MEHKFSYGDKVKCKITAKIGIVTGKLQYAGGPPQIQSTVCETHDGKTLSGWEDESYFDLVEAGFVKFD